MKWWIKGIVALILCLALCGCNTKQQDISLGDIYTDAASGTLSFSAKKQASETSNQSAAKSSTKNSSKKSSSKAASSKPSVTSKPGSDKPLAQKSIKIRSGNRAYFHTVGRAVPSAGSGLQLAWGGSSISFDLLCEKEICLTFSLTAEPEQSFRPVYIRITVDGAPLSNGRTEMTGSAVLTVATDLSYATHRIEITRLTDGDAPPLVLQEIQTYGSLVTQAPKAGAYYIEAIGDDALLGRGILSNDASLTTAKAASSAWQDATKTYPYLAAEALQADCYLFARTGAGLATGYLQITEAENGSFKQVCDPFDVIPNIYPLTDLYTKAEYKATRSPDVIVLDLGRADIQKTLLKAVSPNGISSSKAISLATDFLIQLKQSYPEAKIVWCYGLLSKTSSLETYIQSVARKAGGESADIYLLPLDPASRSGLPTATDHKQAAAKLLKKLQEIL